jgi:hypothetical protein
MTAPSKAMRLSLPRKHGDRGATGKTFAGGADLGEHGVVEVIRHAVDAGFQANFASALGRFAGESGEVVDFDDGGAGLSGGEGQREDDGMQDEANHGENGETRRTSEGAWCGEVFVGCRWRGPTESRITPCARTSRG